jgi:de-etiolated-1
MCVRFCMEDDAYLVTSAFPGINCRPFKDVAINSLKHRLLVYLYKRADYISYVTKDPYELRRFYQYFDQVLFGKDIFIFYYLKTFLRR